MASRLPRSASPGSSYIDAVAVEVERIGEAHRFTAKLLSDRLEPLPADAKAGREPNG